MSTVTAPSTGAGQSPMSPRELGELLAAFNEVTSRLQATHEQLNAEVIRLRTELVEANHQLERSRRLAALGEMAAGIAHEVRNPLGSIRLYAKMLDEDLVDRPAQRETVRKIAGAARGLDQIVGDMLSFAREFRVRVDACDASDLFDQALARVLSRRRSGLVPDAHHPRRPRTRRGERGGRSGAGAPGSGEHRAQRPCGRFWLSTTRK
jgi:signal transduction histidine kinase